MNFKQCGFYLARHHLHGERKKQQKKQEQQNPHHSVNCTQKINMKYMAGLMQA